MREVERAWYEHTASSAWRNATGNVQRNPTV